MAQFYPTIENIQKFKVQPTEGEWALLHFLERNLDNSFEVYFNPYLNGDRPDVIVMRKDYGVMVIEVKDWNINNFTLDDKKRWIFTQNGALVKSPIDQVLKYKENLYNLHVPELLQLKIKDSRHFSIVSCAVYFHCAFHKQLKEMLVEPFKDDIRYQDFLKYNIDFIGRDSLTKEYFTEICQKRYIITKQPSFLFTESLYTNFKRILSPSIHLKNQGETYTYSRKQKEIIYSDVLEQRIKGVFGSGKTTVLAARAVQAYKRALKRNSNPRILILTFNITLKNFIHDKLQRVDEEFPLNSFIIINYHQFINAELNNLGIEFEFPEDLPENRIGEYLEKNYYGNLSLFEKHKADIIPYDAVLIDEIQDFHRVWMDIIKNYYRDPEGDYVLFGDVKQNIYGQPTIQKDVSTNVRGVNELKYCFRSDFKVRDLALAYQKEFYNNKYDLDDFEENKQDGTLDLQVDKEGYINYIYLQGENPIVSLYNIIRGNILNKAANISPNDITVLGYTHNMLRLFDAYYRYSSRESTTTMMETIETMYMSQLNVIENDPQSEHKQWFENISGHFRKKMFPNKQYLSSTEKNKLKQQVAILFTIYDLYEKYNETFISRLAEECDKCGINVYALIAFRKHYEELLTAFVNVVYCGDYKYIQDNKKLHFWMNSGTIKISTINSFKGWESEVVFLIVEKKYDSSTRFNDNFAELLYTGLTRCKRNLVIINYGNEGCDKKLRPIIRPLTNAKMKKIPPVEESLDVSQLSSTTKDGWSIKESRPFSTQEIDAVKSAVIVASDFGNSVCFFMKAGGQTFIPLSITAKKGVGESVDLRNAKILTLTKSGEADIIRVEC